MEIKKQWQYDEVKSLFEQPFIELVYKAQTIHRKNFQENSIELCTLLSIKTGLCPEDCAYCPQSAHYDTGISKENLLPLDQIVSKAKLALKSGAKRFCMGAAWRSPPKKKLAEIMTIIQEVKKLGLETCMTLGMLDEEDANDLKKAGLDYYNHNLDTSPTYYSKIISTREYSDRLNTLENVRKANIHVCCGGIIGMGETLEDRIELLLQLTRLATPPESVPINKLIPIPGTPLANESSIENFEFVKMIAISRIMLPTSRIRLSAGRNTMSEEMQALCILAGANSIHYGEKLLVTENPDQNADLIMLKKLGLTIEKNYGH